MPLDDATIQQPAPAKAPIQGKTKSKSKGKKDEILLNPDLKDIIQEGSEKHAVMAFGRMNPPTTGHEALVKKMHDVAKEHNASHVLVASHSQDAKKNPLSGEDKVKHLKRFFPKTNIELSNKEHPTFLQHAAKLHKAGATHLHMIAGSDRVKEFHDKLHQYNGTGEGKLFNFKSITVHSSGERDPDAEGTSGMSASKMREHAKSNDYASFKKGVPAHVPEKHAKELFHDTRKGMHIAESVELIERIISLQQRRKRAQTMKRYSSKLARTRALARKRMARAGNIEQRTKRVAKSIIRTRFGGSRGQNYKNLTAADKMAVDRQINNKLTWAPVMQKRLKPKVRQAEVRRLQAALTHKKYVNTLVPKPKKYIKNSVEFNDLFKQYFTEDLQLEQFNRIYDLVMEEHLITESEEKSLIRKSEKSGIPLTVIQEVYDRGVEEWSEETGKTPQQVAFERVNSFINQGETFHTKDKDLNESFGSFFTAKDLGMKAQGGFAFHPSVIDEDATSHIKAANQLQQQGKSLLAGIHRRIASAINSGDNTTATALSGELAKKKSEMHEATMSFAVPPSFVEMLRRAQKQLNKRHESEENKDRKHKDE